MMKYIILALIIIIIFVIFLILNKSNHNNITEVNSFAESQRMAEEKLAELTKDKPKDVTYSLAQKPTDVGSGFHLWEFIFTPNKTPYPADGIVRNFSIVIVVNQELQKIVSVTVGDTVEEQLK